MACSKLGRGEAESSKSRGTGNWSTACDTLHSAKEARRDCTVHLGHHLLAASEGLLLYALICQVIKNDVYQPLYLEKTPAAIQYTVHLNSMGLAYE